MDLIELEVDAEHYKGCDYSVKSLHVALDAIESLNEVKTMIHDDKNECWNEAAIYEVVMKSGKIYRITKACYDKIIYHWKVKI